MQTTEHDEQQLQVTPADPQSQPLPPVSPAQGVDDEDDPDHIFLRAVAEIDTQLLSTGKRESTTLADVLEIAFLVSVLLFGLLGSAYLAITYPHRLVVLFTKAKPASIITTLDLPTRTLAPVTLTRSAATLATGTGHQDARAATGTLTVYNGLFTVRMVPMGTVFTGADGVRVTTTAAAPVPAANPLATPPQLGSATVTAEAVQSGAASNIAAYDINTTFGNGVTVKNLIAFSGGRDARTYSAVAPQDLQSLTSTVNDTLTQAFRTAFPLQPGEQEILTTCHTTTSPTHQIGQEAHRVTLSGVETCSAMAYNHQQVEHLATAIFTTTRPGASYHLVGSVQATVQRVSPVTVTVSGTWAYTFTPDYQQSLTESIAGKTPAQARTFLLRTGVISYASISGTLPPDAMYINFLVLVG